MINILAAIIGYLLGAIPFSKILVHKHSNINVLQNGTGNAGAMNSYETTGKKSVGIAVFILDLLKGYVACYIVSLIEPAMFTVSLAGVFSVIGHNFNAFLKFRGGRGLAAATGVLLFFNPLATIDWAIMWLIAYYGVRKNVHVANALATVAAPFLIIQTPEKVADIFKLYDYENYIQYIQLVVMLAILIFLKHIEPLRKLMKEKRLFSENKD